MAAASARRLVAVMFTDMAGYTALMQANERRAVEKRNLYLDSLRREHEAAGGTIVQLLGDGSLSMFPSALAAVRAGVAVQRMLTPEDVPVRIGIHVGDVLVEPERLTGDAVNIAARIESFAVPGSVFVSDVAYEQIKNQPEIDVTPLGSFRLKNVTRPFDLYAVAGPGLVVPARSTLKGKGGIVDAIRASLPEPTTALLGRGNELEELAGLVRRHRILTITGPGGVGKTRLVTALGHLLAPEFPDGAALVGFADVTEASDFLPALGAALDVKEAEERPVADGIVALLAERQLLLVLDNLEQIVGAAPDVAGIVARCPEVRIVTTSRTPLRIGGEYLYALQPLRPDDAFALFRARAEAVSPGFRQEEHADAVGEICRRLDGLPLALELAAARLRLLGPEGLSERLDRSLDVLTTGARDSHERQQTLRATIDWSYSLLDEAEQRVFRCLAVFAGGSTLADAEAVTGEGSLDKLESLVDAALVVANGRLRLLQTIADFARERLDGAGETAEVAARHARRFATVAREIRDAIEGTDQLAAIERGTREEENLHAALDTLLASARAGAADALERGLQMSGDLWMYWHIRGKNVTAQEYAGAFLEADGSRRPSAGRAAALLTVALGSWMTGKIERAQEEWREASQIAEAAGAGRELCSATVCQSSLGLFGMDIQAALASAKAGIEQSRAQGFDWALGIGLLFDGMLHALTGDSETARARYTEALEIQQPRGDLEGAGMSLGALASLAAQSGDALGALDLYRQALSSFEGIGDRGEEARILSEMAWTYLAASDTASARRYFFESVRAHTDIASVRGVGLSLVGLGAAEAVDGRDERAAQIAAAAEMLAQEEGIVVVYSDETPGRELVERARAALAPDELARATQLGRRLTIAEVLELATRADKTASP